MLSDEIQKQMYEEANDKWGAVAFASSICYLGAGVLAVPIYYLSKKFLVHEAVAGFLQGLGLASNDPRYETAFTLLLFLVAIAAAKAVAETIIPRFSKKIGGSVYSIEAAKELSVIDVAHLEPIVKKAQRNSRIFKIAIAEPSRNQWTHSVNFLVKYVLMFAGYFVGLLLVSLVLWLFST